MKWVPLIELGVCLIALSSPGEDAVMPPPNAVRSVTARRCDANPLICFATSPHVGTNIRG